MPYNISKIKFTEKKDGYANTSQFAQVVRFYMMKGFSKKESEKKAKLYFKKETANDIIWGMAEGQFEQNNGVVQHD